MALFTLSKQERITSRKEAETLFDSGQSLTKFPIRLVWQKALSPDPFPAKVLFTVSKKKFPKAVDRNRIRRLMRESYRLLKPEFYDSLPEGRTYLIAFIYTAGSILDFSTIQKGLASALDRLQSQITNA